MGQPSFAAAVAIRTQVSMNLRCIPLLAMALLLPTVSPASAETIDIAIGHQTMCTDTYTGGVVIKELKLLEKHLPHTGKYADATYNISWADYPSGGPITNQMLAGKLHFGTMGDYPLIVNGAKFQETKSLRTVLFTGTGYNLKGAGNAIVVPVASNYYKLEDLTGKSISTPVGSASWGMLVKALQVKKMPLASIDLKNQTPPVGASNIATNKVDAHSDFCPWSEIMEFRGTGRKIYDGSELAIPYLHGVVVRQDFAEKYPEVVVAFVKAVYDAGKWIDEDPMRATDLMEKWTGVEKEVLYLYFSKGGHLTQDPTLKKQWVDTLKVDHQVLVNDNLAPGLGLRRLDQGGLSQARLRRDGTRLRSRKGQGRRYARHECRPPERDLARARRHRLLSDAEGVPQGGRRIPRQRPEAQCDLCLRPGNGTQALRQDGVLRPQARRRLCDLPAQG